MNIRKIISIFSTVVITAAMLVPVAKAETVTKTLFSTDSDTVWKVQELGDGSSATIGGQSVTAAGSGTGDSATLNATSGGIAQVQPGAADGKVYVDLKAETEYTLTADYTASGTTTQKGSVVYAYFEGYALNAEDNKYERNFQVLEKPVTAEAADETVNANGKIEIKVTPTEDCAYMIIKLYLRNANGTATYSNVKVTYLGEDEGTVTPDEPTVQDGTLFSTDSDTVWKVQELGDGSSATIGGQSVAAAGSGKGDSATLNATSGGIAQVQPGAADGKVYVDLKAETEYTLTADYTASGTTTKKGSVVYAYFEGYALNAETDKYERSFQVLEKPVTAEAADETVNASGKIEIKATPTADCAYMIIKLYLINTNGTATYSNVRVTGPVAEDPYPYYEATSAKFDSENKVVVTVGQIAECDDAAKVYVAVFNKSNNRFAICDVADLVIPQDSTSVDVPTDVTIDTATQELKVFIWSDNLMPLADAATLVIGQ